MQVSDIDINIYHTNDGCKNKLTGDTWAGATSRPFYFNILTSIPILPSSNICSYL